MSWAETILFVHLAAAVVWLGGSLFLIASSVCLRRWTAPEHPRASNFLVRGDRITCVVVWPALITGIVTGFYNLTWYFPGGLTADSVLADPWVVAKLLSVAVILGAAGLHTMVTSPRSRAARRRAAPVQEIEGLRRTNRVVGYLSTAASLVAVVLGIGLGLR